MYYGVKGCYVRPKGLSGITWLAWGSCDTGYRRRWRDLEMSGGNIEVQLGAPPSHTKGCPENAPHSPLPPPSTLHQIPLMVFPAHTPTHMLTHTGARKQVKRFIGPILWQMCTHSNRTEWGTKDCEWGLGSGKKKPLTRFKQPQGWSSVVRLPS